MDLLRSNLFYLFPPAIVVLAAYRGSLEWPVPQRLLYLVCALGFGVFVSLTGYIHTGPRALYAFSGAAICALICTIMYLNSSKAG